jgi:hypothetical protein
VHGDVTGRYSNIKAADDVDPDANRVTVSCSSDKAIPVMPKLRYDTVDAVIRGAIRRQVETEIYIPCSDSLKRVISMGFAEKDDILEEKCIVLKHMPQSFFGIPVEYISPSSWEAVIHSLSGVPNASVPYDKLQQLVHAAKMIPRCYQDEHPSASQSLGADDMLPVFIYSLVMARMGCMYSLSQELEFLCDADCRVSEIGYYIATFEACIQHIEALDELKGDRDESSSEEGDNTGSHIEGWDTNV